MAIGSQFATDVVRDRLLRPNAARSEDNAGARNKGRHRCPKCQKEFGHYQILHLHLRIHESGENSFPPTHNDYNAEASTTQKNLAPAKKDHFFDDVKDVQQSRREPSSDVQQQTKFGKCSPTNFQPKNLPGLTKIRLEDCLRCDECSCIYMDKSDYMKHMKNFHNSSPKKQKQKKGCRSCCRHCNCRNRHKPQKRVKAVDKGNNNLFHHNIKYRWSKILAQTIIPNNVPLKIKEEKDCDPDEPDEMTDYSHLLSQVEVKIKTEPPEEQDFT